MQPYQTKFMAFLNSVWEETPEPEPRILAAILNCVPFLDFPHTVSRQRVRTRHTLTRLAITPGLKFLFCLVCWVKVTLRIVRSLAWATVEEERRAGVNALAFMMAKYADEVLLSSLSSVLSYLEDLPEQEVSDSVTRHSCH